MREWVDTPLMGIFVTCVAYLCGGYLNQRIRSFLMNPVFVSIALIITFLVGADIDYNTYNQGGKYISFLLGPAVVALAVPLYRQIERVKRDVWMILPSLLVGSLAGIFSAAGTARLLNASRTTILSVAPKSVTTPIALGISAKIGGLPPLSAALVILTGVMGAMVGPEVIRAVGVRSRSAIGLGVGAASHGIGTARALQEDELTGVMSGLGMVLNGVITALILPFVIRWIV